MSSLENGYPTLLDLSTINKEKGIHIVVLGGGHGENIKLTSLDQLSDASRSRLMEGLRLFRILPESSLIFTGKAKKSGYSHAKVMRESAILIGVDEKLIKILPAPENTRMEALDYSEKFGFADQLILVTDAAHMQRAMYHFKSVGLNPIPAPTNHLVKSETIEDWRPSQRNIELMDYFLHETLGLLWAKMVTKDLKV